MLLSRAKTVHIWLHLAAACVTPRRRHAGQRGSFLDGKPSVFSSLRADVAAVADYAGPYAMMRRIRDETRFTRDNSSYREQNGPAIRRLRYPSDLPKVASTAPVTAFLPYSYGRRRAALRCSCRRRKQEPRRQDHDPMWLPIASKAAGAVQSTELVRPIGRRFGEAELPLTVPLSAC